jgi:hypothetical protein
MASSSSSPSATSPKAPVYNLSNEWIIKSHYKMTIEEDSDSKDCRLSLIAWKVAISVVFIPGKKREAFHAVFAKMKKAGERMARRRKFPEGGPAKEIDFDSYLKDDWEGVVVVPSSSRQCCCQGV